MTGSKILISQNAPSNLAPYASLTEKFGVEFEFKPFFKVEPLTGTEFRKQRLNIAEYTAIVFSSRHAIDAYFALCEDARFKVPETMKYFCTTEMIAMYLQKHIVYRKRKIFFGEGTPESVVSLISAKHKGEKFLITTSDNGNTGGLTSLFDAAGLDYSVGILVKSVPQDLTAVDFNAYSIAVLYNPADVKSLFANFPEFKQGSLKIVSYGKSVVKSLEEAGLEIAVQAPTPEAPSVAKALEIYLSQQK